MLPFLSPSCEATPSYQGVIRCCRFVLFAGVWMTACCTSRHPQQAASTVPLPAKPAATRTKSEAAPRTIETSPSSPEQRLGVIRAVGAHGSFVLIETPSASVTASLPTGSLLHCHPAGTVTGSSTADLRVSPERRQPFVTADVVAGTPTVGDIAYLARESTLMRPVQPVVPFSSVIPAAEPTPAPAANP